MVETILMSLACAIMIGLVVTFLVDTNEPIPKPTPKGGHSKDATPNEPTVRGEYEKI